MRRAFAAFFGTLLVITGVCWLIVGSFVVDDLGGWSRLALLWAVCVSPAGVLFYNILRRAYPSSWMRCTIYRLFWYSQFLVVMLLLPTVAGFIIGLPFGRGAEFGRAVVLIGGVLLLCSGLVGYVGSKRLVVRQLEVRSPQLPAALDGLRIAQLSDTHVGPHTSPSHLRTAAQFASDAKPHLIAFTGDQVDDYPRDMEVFQRYFGALKAPLGVFAIAGNHDVYAGWHEVRPRLEAMGVTVLVNRAVKLTHNGADFWLGGTGDPAGFQMARFDPTGEAPAPDIKRTLAGIPAGAFHIVLAHNPALFAPLAERGVPLTLSGHTHYGQFVIRALNWSLASPFLKYAMGAHVVGQSALYINPGTNYWGIPFRIGTPPEVTVLTLRRGEHTAVVENNGGGRDNA